MDTEKKNRPEGEIWTPRGDWRNSLALLISMFAYDVPWFVLQWRWPLFASPPRQGLPPLSFTLGLGVGCRASACSETVSSQSRIDPRVAAKLAALRATPLELAARRPPDLVDRARIAARRGAEMDARAVLAMSERHLAEMPGDDRRGDIVAPHSPPAHQILLGDQDAPIAAFTTAGAAGQTVELFVGDRHRSRRI